MANPMGKTRPASDPYLTVKGPGGFTYKVLRAYALDPNKKYGRWYLATSSPFTYGEDEYGDGYIATVTGTIVQRDPSVPDSALPLHLLGLGPVPRDPMEEFFGN